MFPLKKKVFRLAAICLIASFMFDVFGNPVLAKKLAIEKEELDRIQTFLSFSRDFANIVLDNAKIKNVLNLAVTSQKEADDLTVGGPDLLTHDHSKRGSLF